MDNNKKMQHLGRLVLFSAALLWGVSFVMMKNVLDNVPPLYILTFRFFGAALLLLPFCISRLKKLDKDYIKGGVLMGVALFAAYVFQTYGLRYTTPGKNAFLTSVYCVIVPFLYWAIIRKKPDKFNAIAAGTCIIGIALITLYGDMRIALGDGLTLIGGFFFALHIIVSAGFVRGRNPIMLTMIQFATVGVLSLLGAVMFEASPSGVTSTDVWSIVFLTVVCTAGCLLMQAFGQKYTPPAQSAVILTLESVFGVLASVLLFHEILTPRLTLGFALTFIAVIISETKMGFLRKKQNLAR
ncbi:MAG: DMT family transporter [Oscillospiraceae bacterium]|nr:DMT family transporter [Oscillospiraceae bacterium]